MTYRILTFLFLLAFTINAQVTITDITGTNLIGDKDNNGEYGGHGIMFGDADGDGDPDMYITMNRYSPMSDQLFINNGNGIYTEDAVNRGVDDFDLDSSPTDDYGSHGWVWADLDNDGDFDGWNGSYSENIPYKNKNDQPGYFEAFFSNSGIDSVIYFTRGVVAFDYDKDGDLDLFANNWYNDGFEQENEFYRNNGDMTFTRIDNGLTNSKGEQGVCAGDFDNDGDIDLLISVFLPIPPPQRCVEIWENVNGQFVVLPNHGGIDLCERADGSTFWDMNNDGWLDVVSGHKIFLNNKDKTFSEVPNIPAGLVFMRGIADLNNDGYWDMVTPGSDKVYINKGDLTFDSISYVPGTTPILDDPRCVSFADIDGDGDVDFALALKEAHNRLYRNDYSGSNRYLFVKLKTADNQIGAYGAKVYIYTPDGNTLLSYREAHSNHGYLAQDDPVMHFGCGVRDSVRVKVVFLNGHVVELNTATNQTVEIIDSYLIHAPSNLFAFSNPEDGQNINLSWIDNSSNEFGFIIERKTGDSASAAPFKVLDTLASNSTSYVDSSPHTDTTTYTFRVKAFNSFSESDYSNVASLITILTSLTAPTELTASLDPTIINNVALNWHDNSSNELGFIVERKTGDSASLAPFTVIDTVASDMTYYLDSSTHIDTTAYTFRVKAFNSFTESDYSNVASLITVLSFLPAPTNLTVNLDSTNVNRIQLNWNDNSTEELGFIVERKTGDSLSVIPFTLIDSVAMDIISYEDSTIEDSTTYTYRVRAFNHLFLSDYSNIHQITTSIIADIISTKVDLGIPKDFALEQNFPNPFNPSTSIRFALPTNSKVTLKLFNTLGQEAANILDMNLSAGIHETIFNAANLSSGVYFYMLKVQGENGSNFTSTKRMILMK